jgi:hypothetical protein
MNGTEMNGKVTGGEPVEEKLVSPEMSLINVPSAGLSIEREIAEIEKNVEFFNRVKIVALKLTKPTDWVDQGGSMYLMDRGAENIAIAFGVDISDVGVKMEWAEDPKGRYYSYVATGKAYSKKLGRYVEDIGVCSQRDRFFGMVGGKLKEIEDVDAANIRRKAVTNLYSRLIKRVIGLSGVTADDLKAAGIDPGKIGKIEYRGGGQRSQAELTPEEKDVRAKLGNMLLMMANNDKAEASKLLEKYSFWKDGDGKEHSASSLEKMSAKWIQSTYGKAKKDYEKTAGGSREPGEEG